MLKNIFFKLLVIVGLIFSREVQSQVRFHIEPGSKQIGRTDQLQVSYTIDGTMQVSGFRTSAFAGWSVISGPSVSSQEVSINGNSKVSTSYVYVLTPRQVGNLKLPMATAIVNGHQMTCFPIWIKVSSKRHLGNAGTSPSSAGNSLLPDPAQLFGQPDPDQAKLSREENQSAILKPGENWNDKIKSNLFVRVIASKTNCVVGEPLLITYKLYTRLPIEAKLAKQPSFNSCTIYEMTPLNPTEGMEKVNGKLYKTCIVRQVQIFPLQPGDIKMDAAVMDNNVMFYRQSYFNNVPENHHIQIASQPLVIHVHALPGNGSKDANGTVGNFSIDAHVARSIFPAQDNNTLYVTITGEGNFQSITTPSIKWPDNIDHFDGKDSSLINKQNFPSSGSKTFSIPFVANEKGKMVIPPIHFTFYNPETGKYESVQTDSIPLNVKPAEKNQFLLGLGNRWYHDQIFYIIALFIILALLVYAIIRSVKRSKENRIKALKTAQYNAEKQRKEDHAFHFASERKEKNANENQEVDNQTSQEKSEIFEKDNTEIRLRDLRDLYEHSNYSGSLSEFISLARNTALEIEKQSWLTSTEKEKIQKITLLCNEALYSPNASVQKETIYQLIESLLEKSIQIKIAENKQAILNSEIKKPETGLRN